jgi:hypothetical protein
MVMSIYPLGVGSAPANSGEVAQPHLLLRVLQGTCREIDLFNLLRIALFGFSSLASASPDCASADDGVARGRYIVENVAKCTECHSPRGQNEELGRGLSLSGVS